MYNVRTLYNTYTVYCMNGLNNNCGRILYPLLQDEGGKFKYTNSNLNKEGEGGRLVRSPSLGGGGILYTNLL
jgi:hypothetical protein